MTIIRIISSFLKKKISFLTLLEVKTLKVQRFNPLIILSFFILFTCFFFITSNLINKKNENKLNNFKEVANTNEFSNLTNFIMSQINSPYEEINYIIKNNDTVEKILSNFKVREKDINKISIKLKEKNLTNIYSGRKLKLIIKKLEGDPNTIINFYIQ